MDNRIDAIYGRQSIDKKDSISIESQFEFCRYELKGGEAKEYKDKGYSGKNIERPDFQRLLQDIRLGLIKRVIVYKLDRISRSIVDFAKLMELFKQYDVEFVSCTEKFDTSTPMGRAMLNICIVFAQLERESIQMRVQDAFYSRCINDNHTSLPPRATELLLLVCYLPSQGASLNGGLSSNSYCCFGAFLRPRCRSRGIIIPVPFMQLPDRAQNAVRITAVRHPRAYEVFMCISRVY